MEERAVVLNEQIKAIEEAIDFFNGYNKRTREILVVNEFLSNLSIKFDKNEIKPNSEDPPDIIFREARFEIKEIQDQGRERHREFKEDLKKAKNAKTLSELFKPVPFQEVSIQEIVNRIEEELNAYIFDPALSPTIDMLFYVNLSFFEFKGDITYDFSKKNILEKWRSVSMLENGKISFVFYARKDAPEFLRSNAGSGRFYHRDYFSLTPGSPLSRG